MSSNENTGSIPKPPESSEVEPNAGSRPGQHPTEQPVTKAGGILGPLEKIIEKSEESQDKA